MNTLSFDELKENMIVVMSKAGKRFPGLAGRMFKVISIDDPYIVIETGPHLAATRHMIVGREAEFMLPSKETIAAMQINHLYTS